MAICGTAVGQDSGPDCTNPSAAGTTNYFHIIDWDEFQLATVTWTAKVYSAIALATVGQEAAKIECLPNTIDATCVQQAPGADGQKPYIHSIGAVLQGMGATEKAKRLNYGRGKYVLILRTNGGEAEDSFQIFGLDCGVTWEGQSWDTKANNGSIIGRFVTPSGGASPVFESEEPYNVWITSTAATLAMIALLETPVPTP